MAVAPVADGRARDTGSARSLSRGQSLALELEHEVHFVLSSHVVRVDNNEDDI